ncbi:uncharacterized aarF domain-containing protein kinase 1 [Lingula anatina]|uniref:Uncharacterized aarF domain-containing protein kinase 1 n=1 Tax=Lingula anatina TaxID=7574 RepID=A0A1S3IJK6_LINAN|nr:uncharacterized aarF domain-containing protein kinase 1 [Lingula anatina]|eukprot:XP_013398397.1 uncharacterized aarF domain-containing protein kinase 1 [Lingula anatina]
MVLTMMLKRLLKYSFGAGALGGSAYFLYKNEWEVSTLGAVRFGRAALTIARVALDYKLSLQGQDSSTEEYKKIKSDVHLRSALRLRDMCCANGGCFIKVGQHVGALDYLLPQEYVETMKVLHSKAPESDIQDLYKVIKEDLGTDSSELFASFDPHPLGAASLAQVHKASLQDGTVVAVKVQHPKVKGHSYVDMKSMELLVHCIAWLFPEFKFLWLAEEMKKNLPKELDFLHEGHNCERMARIFAKFKFLKVPKIYWDLSSERVLTMEFCEGGQVDDKQYMTEHGISVNEVSRQLGELYSEMIFVQGYVHCDPHPGNVLVNQTEKGPQIVLLDHGLYTTLTDSFRLNYGHLWTSLLDADLEGMKHYADVMGCGDLYGLFACVVTGRSWTAISSGIKEVSYSTEEDNEIKNYAATYLTEIAAILNRVPREMLLILKTNDLLRGIEFSLKTHAKASSFITMSRCCVRAIAAQELRECTSWWCRVRVTVHQHMSLLKIDLYEFYIWLRETFIISTFLSVFWHR